MAVIIRMLRDSPHAGRVEVFEWVGDGRAAERRTWQICLEAPLISAVAQDSPLSRLPLSLPNQNNHPTPSSLTLVVAVGDICYTLAASALSMCYHLLQS